jgi:sugar (pentulose or hexulose) kinase
MTAVYLGIDIGTSAVKALLADEEQRVVAEATQELAISRPQPLWSEQNPEDWWSAVVRVVMHLQRATLDRFSAIRGVGLSGQMHGAVLLGTDRAVLRPAILWNDGRSHEQCLALEQRVPQLGIIAGVPAMPGFTAPKLLWIAQHEPEIFARIGAVGGDRLQIAIAPRIAGFYQWQVPFGVVSPVQEMALIARRHMLDHGTTEDHLGEVADQLPGWRLP